MDRILINLATFEYLDKRIAYPMLFGAAIILIAISWYMVKASYQYQNHIFEYEKRIESLDQKILTRQSIKQKTEKIGKDETTSLQSDIVFVNERIKQDVFPWDRLLDALERNMPDRTVLLSISPSKGQTGLRLQGKAESMEEVGMFLKNLNQSTIFPDNRLVNLAVNREGGFQGGANGESGAIKYELESIIDMDQLLKGGIL